MAIPLFAITAACDKRTDPSLLAAPAFGLSRNFLFDLENGTIVHPFRLFATL
jgi:hypothetical protein